MSSYQPQIRIWANEKMWYPNGKYWFLLDMEGKVYNEHGEFEWDGAIPLLSTGIKKDNDLLWDGDILQYELPILGTLGYLMIGWYPKQACWGLYCLDGKSRELTLHQMTRWTVWKKAKKVGNRFESKALMERYEGK